MSEKNIFLIEDNKSDIELIKWALKKSDFEDKISLKTVTRGEDALNLLFKQKDKYSENGKDFFDLIVLDLNLPAINGLEVLKKIREKPTWDNVPIVVFTSSRYEDDIKKAYRYGANSYINKPVSFEDFVGIIHKIGEYRFYMNCSI